MSTITEIQDLVDVALGKINKGDFDGVKTDTWPHIRSAINEYPGLSREGKTQLLMLIHARLDVLGLLQAGKKPVDIDVKRLTLLIQERLGEPGSQKSAPDWLPW